MGAEDVCRRRKISVGVLLLTGAMLQGCVTHHLEKDCAENFATEGSFLTGKRFTTASVFPAMRAEEAYKRVYTVLAKEGFDIESSDEKKGIISARQNVSLSSKTAPLNAIVESQGGDSKVSLVFIASAGIYTPEAGAKAEFCKIIEQAKN